MSWVSTFFVGLVVVTFSLVAIALATVSAIVFGEAVILALRTFKSR
jgi:hypothetical protein